MSSLLSAHALTEAAASASRDSHVAIQFEHSFQYNPSLGASRFRLPNGLRLVLMPDHRASVLAYQTWFKVGSRDEDPNATGMAHFLEHLMFKGTAKHPLGELDREMERRGAQTNAATWVDWTFYTQTLAATRDNLQTLIDFEADRMIGLQLDAKTFASELEVVKNERRMSVDNSPSGALSEAVYRTAYTVHPYRSPTIGSAAHLEAMQRERVEAFYKTFYAPNNAVVVAAGAIDVVETLTLLAQGYGKLEAQTLPVRAYPVEPRQIASRQFTRRDQVLTPIVVLAFHAPPQLSPDFAALEIVSEVLAVGDNARLYRRLVTDEGLASDVSAVLVPFADPGLYEVVVSGREEADPEAIVAAVQDELNKLAQGLTQSERQKAANGLELSLYDGLKDAEGCAEPLGHYEANYGDYSLMFTALGRYEGKTAEDLARVCREVFRVENRTVGITLKAGE